MRKCSALLAAGTGAAVCLTGGMAHAVNGAIGNTIFINNNAYQLGGKIKIRNSGGVFIGCLGANNTWIAGSGSYSARKLATYSAGDGIGPGDEWFSGTPRPLQVINPGGWSKYIKIKFNDGTQYYGWSVFANIGGTYLFGAWSYSPAGTPINTLGESVTAKKLGLSDGRTKLLWSNANEDGVARYEVQAKDASGAWNAVSSDAAGAGSYSATVPAGATCRVVVEKVDSATEEIEF